MNTTTASPLEYLGFPSTTQIAIRPSKLASQTHAAMSGKKAYGPYTVDQLQLFHCSLGALDILRWEIGLPVCR